MSKHFTILMALLAWGRLLPGQNFPDAASDTVIIQEVVVTASKIPLPQRETAKPVQIITRRDIEEGPARDLAQLLDGALGLSVNGANSNPGLNKGLYLRGAAAAYTLLLIDGQPVSDPTGVGGTIDLRLFPVDLIERIEVLKGSQSTLYGTDAIAGVINVITRSGGDRPLGLRGAFSYGSFNSINASAGLHGTLGPLRYNVDYQHGSSDGISEATDPAGSGDYDRDGFNQDAVQLRGALQLGQHLQLIPYFRYSDFRGDTDADAFVDAPNTYLSRFLNPGLNGRLDFGKLTARIDYGYTTTTRKFMTGFGDFPFEGRFHNGDALVSYRFGEHLQLLSGVNFQHQQIRDTTVVPPDPGADIVSPYLTVLLRNLGGLNLEAGYRLNHHSTFGNQSTVSLAPSYQLTKQLRLFASFTTGFKAPTLFELYGAFGGNVDLAPQTSRSWEAGLQSQWLEGKLQGSITYFSRRISNIIVYSFTTGYFNQDRQDDQGVELAVDWRLSPKLDIHVDYAFVDGRVTTKNAAEQDTSYFNLIRRPRHRGGLAINYRPGARLVLGLRGQYNGERIDYFFNPDNSYALEEVDLAPYLLINAHASYQLLENKLTIFADLRNITGSSFTEVYGYNSPGFNACGGVRIKL